jgi:hypothetical protein
LSSTASFPTHRSTHSSIAQILQRREAGKTALNLLYEANQTNKEIREKY